MKALIKFAVLLPVVTCAVIYMVAMISGSLTQFIAMISVLVAAVLVWAPIIGEWIES